MSRLLVEFQSKYLLRKTEVILYVPTLDLQESLQQQDVNYYQNCEKKYPLMILLAGFGMDKSGWEQNSNIAELSKKYGVAVALVGGENKWYMNFSPIDNWDGFLNVELPDFIYGNFSSISKDKPLYIAGCSMGGYGALRNYLSNIDKYKACCALSPATKADNNLEQMLGQKTLNDLFEETKDVKKNIYLSVGTCDFIIEPSREYNEYLKNLNCGVSYKFVEGYDHSFRLWNIEIEEFLKYVSELD